MNIYIAYKFSNVENKQALREQVQTVANILESKGHNTFILGRDLQRWKDFTHPLHHKMRTIVNQIRKSDIVFAYVNSENFSKGLLFELVCAKLLGKKIYLSIKKDLKDRFMELFAGQVVPYATVFDLQNVDVH